jgi:hypothetical protein
MPPDDETPSSLDDVPFVLPKHIRFARSLALVSGAVIGIAAGAAVFGSGCGGQTVCNGFCGFPGVQPAIDAQYDRPVDHANDRPDGSTDAREVASDGQSGGGPRPAPHLPADWLA